jgi:23S rRNA pseudouridine1911/1915/1917 synthase
MMPPRHSDVPTILFEDDHLAVVVKPAGLPTANAPAGAPSVHAWLRQRWGASAFVGIVSRLDAPVSGALVVARTSAAAAHLARQFRQRSVDKTYVAVVEGRFPAPLGEWQDWQDDVIRAPGERTSSVRSGTASAREPPAGVAPPDGSAARPAHTRARVIQRAGEVSLVELTPTTGRRHQLRAQLASRRCPIVGDRRYGARLPHPEPGGIALHARTLAFDHPADGHRRHFTAPWPASWQARFAILLKAAREP